MKTFSFIILTILVQHTIQYENAEEGNLLHPEKQPEEHKEDSHNLKRGDIQDLTNINDYDTGDRQPYSKPLKKHEEDSHNLKRGDIKYLTNYKNYDTGDFQPYNGRYQNYYGELKDKEIMRPLRKLRSASEIKNWAKDMIAMRGRQRRPHYTRKKKGPPHTTKKPRPPHTTKKPRPSHTTKKPRPSHTTKKSKGDSGDSMHIYINNSITIHGNDNDSTEEEQILLEYTPKHKKVDVPMIIFVPLRE